MNDEAFAMVGKGVLVLIGGLALLGIWVWIVTQLENWRHYRKGKVAEARVVELEAEVAMLRAEGPYRSSPPSSNPPETK